MSAPAQAFLARAGEALGRGDRDGATAILRQGLEAHPADAGLLRALARTLKAARRIDEARAALKAALAAAPRTPGLALEAAELELAAGDGPAALGLLAPLMAGPKPALAVRIAAAGAHRLAGDRDQAIALLDAALAEAPDDLDLWLKREILARETGGPEAAVAVLDRALAARPALAALRARHAQALADAGRGEAAMAVLSAAVAADDGAGWAHLQLGRLLQATDRAAANDHLRRALALAPDDPGVRAALAHSLKDTFGADEAAHLEEAAGLLLPVLDRLPRSASAIAAEVLWRTGCYEAVERLGSFAELGRYWAQNGAPTALLQQFARVASDADRLELVAQHRMWGEAAARPARAQPIARPAPRPGDGRIRLGFLSSDLRSHAVGFFVEPLFAHPDPRFELFVYSGFPGPADRAQAWFQARAAGWREITGLSDRDAARRIAEDGLDLLVELGGSTRHARPGVLPYRPAPFQASWLGYPHSLGLAEIDGFVADPHLVPTRPGLLLETPLLMPASWICLPPLAFPDTPAPDPIGPVERTGAITFATTNNSYKYSPRLLQTWARVLAAVPGSQFMFARPEAAAPSFQANMARHFERAGVAAERLVFRPIRARNAELYEGIDIALDTFPQTGGTTTCEALWAGVPVVSMVGEAVYERLSLSILTNAGLADLVARDPDGFVHIAAALAQDQPRLAALRQGLRERIKGSPLGRPAQFASDFYALMARTAGAA